MTARTLTAQEAADALGMSKRALNKAVTTKAGPCDVLPNGSRRFDLDELRTWFAETGSVRNNGGNRAGVWASGGADDQTGMAEAKRRLVLEQTRGLQMANDAREAKLVDAEDARRAWAEQAAMIRKVAGAVPEKAARQIVEGLKLPPEKTPAIVAVLDELLRDALRGLSA
jgi:phage terminase Nu1 subunit (DNA packaging protein)